MNLEPTLIAAGRASEILDLGDGRVLRRGARDATRSLSRLPRSEVLEIAAGALVLEKIEGPTMWEAAARQPSTVAAQAASLARLHDELQV
jgi:hypothetical protein